MLVFLIFLSEVFNNFLLLFTCLFFLGEVTYLSMVLILTGLMYYVITWSSEIYNPSSQIPIFSGFSTSSMMTAIHGMLLVEKPSESVSSSSEDLLVERDDILETRDYLWFSIPWYIDFRPYVLKPLSFRVEWLSSSIILSIL